MDIGLTVVPLGHIEFSVADGHGDPPLLGSGEGEVVQHGDVFRLLTLEDDRQTFDKAVNSRGSQGLSDVPYSFVWIALGHELFGVGTFDDIDGLLFRLQGAQLVVEV